LQVNNEASNRQGLVRYLKILAKQLKQYETNVINNVDGIAAITDEDGLKYLNLGCKKPIITIPFGIEIANSNNSNEKEVEKNLFHIGSMDWKPNLEGIAWFGESVWPKIQEVYPNLKFNIAGRNMPNWLINVGWNNYINHGEVANAKDFISNNSIMVVPLLSAGGMRIKIIEAMALGKVVISTSIGAEGIEYKDRDNILIANKKSDFIKQLFWLFEDDYRMIKIGERARRLVEDKYNNDIINEQLVQFYKSLN